MGGEEWKKVDYFLSFIRKEGLKFFIMTEVESAEKTRLYVSFQLNAGSAVDVLVFNWAEVRRVSLEMRPIKIRPVRGRLWRFRFRRSPPVPKVHPS